MDIIVCKFGGSCVADSEGFRRARGILEADPARRYAVVSAPGAVDGGPKVTDLLEAGMSPTEMLRHLLQGLDYQELDRMPADFRCGCDRSRAKRAVLALGRAELRDMVEKNEPAQVHCHFCGADYRFEPAELADMLDGAGDPAPEAEI